MKLEIQVSTDQLERVPQYRHYDLVTYVARPLKVIPDKLVPIDLEKLKAGRDNQLEAAIEYLTETK